MLLNLGPGGAISLSHPPRTIVAHVTIPGERLHAMKMPDKKPKCPRLKRVSTIWYRFILILAVRLSVLFDNPIGTCLVLHVWLWWFKTHGKHIAPRTRAYQCFMAQTLKVQNDDALPWLYEFIPIGASKTCGTCRNSPATYIEGSIVLNTW